MSSGTRLSRSFAAWVVVASLCGCADAANGGSLDVRFSGEAGGGKPVSQAELQQDIQRFTGGFMDKVTQAGTSLAEGADSATRQTVLRRVVVYESAALDIATGPLPEVNVLDMVVFLKLSRGVLERYWNPRVFGERGHELSSAFAESEQELWVVARKVLSTQQQSNLLAAVSEWEAAHPDQYRVEGVRFFAFAAVAGEVSAERAKSARGLLSQVKSVTQVADQAVLLGNRAMFLTHYMPFLVRAQARLGVQETLGDTIQRIGELESVLARVQATRPLLHDAASASSNAAEAAREARMLLDESLPLFELITPVEGPNGLQEPPIPVRTTVESAERITDNSLQLVRELRQMTPHDSEHAWSAVEQRADRLVRRWIGYLVLLGAAWALLFCAGYFTVKRLIQRPSRAGA